MKKPQDDPYLPYLTLLPNHFCHLMDTLKDCKSTSLCFFIFFYFTPKFLTCFYRNLTYSYSIADIERVHETRTALEGGHEAVLAHARAIYPQMMTFEQWSERRAIWGQSERPEGWNNVTVPALVLGKH